MGTVRDARREQRRWPEIEEARRLVEAKMKMKKPVDVKRSYSYILLRVTPSDTARLAIYSSARRRRDDRAAPRRHPRRARLWSAGGLDPDRHVTGLRKGSSSNDLSLHHRTARHGDRLLGGLLNPGRRPSPYLVAKLRRQEALQRRCGPGTAAYGNAVEQLKSGEGVASPECRYVVSLPYQGLGNRILAAVSAFLYALLTGRVLLIDPATA
ncbi:hypothetical protein C2845_PM09G06590 [Panicum miliaceum]|uniref:Fucosyltransferase n=1 Tax=Panicum miliaceum TaxID=4540 RepID=A0A3L6RW53_PANMI|nr:hypothetical protein C2845_PM09G06590 [Panicum miliaceum]